MDIRLLSLIGDKDKRSDGGILATFLAKTPQQLGAIVRGYRKQRELTQQQLALQLGLPQKAISLAETTPETMSVARLFQLLSALGVELTLRDPEGASTSKAEW